MPLALAPLSFAGMYARRAEAQAKRVADADEAAVRPFDRLDLLDEGTRPVPTGRSGSSS